MEIVIYTILHQLMNVFPVLLLSQPDVFLPYLGFFKSQFVSFSFFFLKVRESPPKSSGGEGYLADAFAGGTGVCGVRGKEQTP